MNLIPQSRMILYVLLAGLLPVFFALFHFLSQKTAVEELQNTLTLVEQLALQREHKQSLNRSVRDNYKEADHFYIDKYLENLEFLKPEAETLQKLVNNKYFAGDENVKKRLEFVTGQENSLLFSEGNVQNYPFFQETTPTLSHPVEVNLNDLKEILAITEGIAIDNFEPGPNRPQLIILDFKLDRKEISENNEVFILNMKLLKREYQ